MLHAFKCLFGSCVRTLNWLLLANVVVTAVRVVLDVQALLRKECGLELAVGPAQLATSAYWTLRGASAFVAGKLGTTVIHVLHHKSQQQ